MTWKATINGDSSVWQGVEDYARERIKDLTFVCVAPESSTEAIRAAQSGILELDRLLSVPQMIASEKQMRSQLARKEY